ncbi:patatin-like phospholipase family protein [Anaerocolumna sp.]|uniref:patatin-like phospholipase family protein n=1 Tax=Anaerocolumna sp. TaxID=2041569 RepID=UPI0028B1A483|nr:patatin family protein [Anaerocolumna sp.]
MTKDEVKTKDVSLVLEGGALRGLFTAGVLDYFMEQGLKFPYVVGVSAGACNLLGYAAHQVGYTKDCMIQRDAKNQYFGINQLLHAKTIINLDRIFYEYPYNQLPFNFKAFFNSGIKTEFVVTNCVTGKAEYLHENSDEHRLGTLGKASASVPLFTKMVELDKKKYLDGGLTDSIPIERAITQGFSKNVVILTRSRGNAPTMNYYQRILYQTFYKDFPQLLEAILNRPAMYQSQLALLDSLQEDGKVFVIRPKLPEIKRFETDPDTLEAYYQHGLQIAKSCWKELQTYLFHSTPTPQLTESGT